MPKISVIVPVYLAENYIYSCVDSILSQTFSDFEVFLVNDGSPDNCGAICEEYAARDSRVHVIHQENQGQSAARNHALTQALGEWICFVDSDDLIHPKTLELMYQAAMESNAGISMCGMAESPEIPAGFFADRKLEYEVLAMEEDTLVSLYDREEYPAWVACAKLIRREIVSGHLFCPGRVFEDNEAVCHWVCDAGRIARIPHDMYFYRTNPGSTTQRTFSLKKLDYLWALEQIIRFYSAIGYGRMKARFADRYAAELVNCSNGLRYDLQRPDLVREIRKNARGFVREENLQLTLEQKEALLDAMHPKLIRFYWPVAGALRTLRENGLTGIVQKMKKQLHKGEEQ